VHSGVDARRFVALLAALSFLSVTLVACQVTGSSPAGSNTSQAFTFTTPNPKALSPTPTFPPHTCGAWVSNFSPQALDNITIYVLCRVQVPDMSGPAQPPSSPVSLTVQIGAPLNKTLTGVTDHTGLGAIPFAFTDPSPGTPVQVTVYSGGFAQPCQTFFTPGATQKPTPTVNPNETPSVTPSGTP
jgi:hypothetical protein